MIITAVVVMYAIKYLSTFTWGHVHFSEMRAYMSVMMGAAMAVIMLAFMLPMYRSLTINVGILVVSSLLFAGSYYLMRTQNAVQDESYMRSMIPHHSIAILTSERADIDDQRVCELAVGITEAQRSEIRQMEWLLDDIAENGAAKTDAQASRRPVPDFSGTAERDC
jgi:uncharacterized protein (DUF305 family)